MSSYTDTPPSTTAVQPLRSAMKKSSSASTSTSSSSRSNVAPQPSRAELENQRIRAAAEVKATQLHQTARAQEQWQEWITKVQMKMIRAGVEPSTMHRASLVLRPCEYEEVVEERASAHLCAYPPCSNSTKSHGSDSSQSSSKKYHLSLKSQRVYDVTAAREFCSEKCFMSSEVYKKGLSDEPFYLRQMKPQRAQAVAAPDETEATRATNSNSHASLSSSKENSSTHTTAVDTISNSITSLLIVEKSPSSLPPTQPPEPKSAQADALTVEGYKPKSATAIQTASTAGAQMMKDALGMGKKTEVLVEFETDANPTTGATRVEEFDMAERRRALEEWNANQPDSTPPSSSSSQTEPILTAGAKSAAPSASSSPSTSAASSTFLEFKPLPSTFANQSASSSFTPLTSAEFAALSSDGQMDYLGRLALMESSRIDPEARSRVLQQTPTPTKQKNPTTSSNSTSTSAPVPSAATPSSGEKKIRRRKTEAEKEQERLGLKSPTQTKIASGVTTDAAAPLPARPSLSPASSSVSIRPRPSHGLTDADILCTDDSDPIINADEVKASVTAVRSASLPPFLTVLQSFMRWTTLSTGTYIRTGRMGASQPMIGTTMDTNSTPAVIRQRQKAFLSMLTQHWQHLIPVLYIHRECQRDLHALTETFAFDDPIPSFTTEQWRLITLVLMRGVAHRMAIDEGMIKRSAMSSSSVPPMWTVMEPFCHLPEVGTSLEADIRKAIGKCGFTVEQFDSIYTSWMLQGEDMYKK